MKHLVLRAGLVGALVFAVGGAIAAPGFAGSKPTAPDCTTARNPSACAAAVKNANDRYIAGVHKANAAYHFRKQPGQVQDRAAMQKKAAFATLRSRLVSYCPTRANPAACDARVWTHYHSRIGTINGRHHARLANILNLRNIRLGRLDSQLSARYAHAGKL